MTKIVFLDIDGVLNTQGDKNLIKNTFEDTKLDNLVRLVLNTNSELVIISDRRLILDERIMIDGVFNKYGIHINYLTIARRIIKQLKNSNIEITIIMALSQTKDKKYNKNHKKQL